MLPNYKSKEEVEDLRSDGWEVQVCFDDKIIRNGKELYAVSLFHRERCVAILN